ncbi:hypothetical protein Daus18300_004783 [Diaporthe australafricana]|uniref:CFEM domain-containing protein n=1 Tax=Diaporthe australafricana TaxID=127596 RepID=A0ABR3X658_9PEZI
MLGLVRGICAVGLAHVILAQQLFANEPTCAEGCYADAVQLSGCGQQDLACQCRAPNFAGIALAGGPCFLAQCSFNDLSSLSSARTAACATATLSTTTAGTGTTAAATTTASASASTDTVSRATSTARRVNTASPSAEVIAALPTPSAVQAVPDNGMGAMVDQGQGQGQTLTAAAITGIVVSGGAVGLVGGILLYFFTVVRRRKVDQAHWDSLEREKAAMQKSLEELKMAVQRSGTFDSLDEKGDDEKDRKRPRTINLTGSKGPGELGVPSRIFELPASPARLEKI